MLIPVQAAVIGGQQMLPPKEEESVTLTVLDSTKVTFCSGFTVIQVNTGFESREILLDGVPDTVSPSDITAELRAFGEVVTVLPADSTKGASTSAYRVAFAQADSAAEAADALQDSLLFKVRVSARVVANKSTGIGHGTLDDGVVLFEIPSPRQTPLYWLRSSTLRMRHLAQHRG